MPDVLVYALDESASFDEGVIDSLVTDYEAVIFQLLPYGPAWEFEEGDTMHALVAGLAREPSRVEGRGRDVLDEFPATAQELLSEWETLLALPLPGVDTSDGDTRRANVVTKLTTRGAASEPFFLAQAATAGLPGASIRRDYDPFRCNSECTHALQGRAGYWLYTWTMLLTGAPDVTLEYLVRLYAQAHEIVHFEYT